MKTLLLALAVVFSVSAFAKKHMITLEGYENERQDRSLDLYNVTGDTDTDSGHVKQRNIALNYAYAVTEMVQVGLTYKNYEAKTSGDNMGNDRSNTTWGLFGIYNLAGRLTDTNYVSLAYDMRKFKESDDDEDDADKVNTWTVGFGHRFSLGTVWGMNFSWSPNVELAFAKTAVDASGDEDFSSTAFTFNPIRFDVLF